MNSYLRFAFLLFVSLFIVVGCSTNTDDGEQENNSNNENNNSEQEKEVETETVNLYSGEDRPTNIADIEHTLHEPIEIDYDSIHYIDEDVLITNGSHAYDFKTGEAIWEDDIMVDIDYHLTTPIYEDSLYFRNGDDWGSITLDTDKSKNEVTDVDEEEYRIRSSEHVYGENSYIVESEDEDDYTLVSYDMDTLEKQWEFELDDYSGIRGEIIETGDYILLDTGEFQVFVLDKTNGEELYEEGDKNFYNDALQVDDKLYAINVNGLTGDFFTLYEFDTNTWEKEEILSYSDDDFLDSTTDITKLVYEENKLLFIYDYGAFIMDLEAEEITHNYIYDDEDADGPLVDFVYFHALIHDSKLYALYEHDFHNTLSIIDIEIGEVLEEYSLGEVGEMGSPSEMSFPSPDDLIKSLEKVNDDTFVIITREDGIFELDFSDVE